MGQTATISSTTIHGLAPADITYSDLTMLTVNGGSGGNTFTVQSTPAATILHTGTGNDTTSVEATANLLNIVNDGGMDNVTIGTASAGLQDITGPMGVISMGTGINLTLDDTADMTARTVTIQATRISGLAPVDINFLHLTMFTVDAGSGGNTFTILNVPAVTILNTGTGNDTTNVEAAAFALTIHGQAGSDTVILGMPAAGPPRSVQNITETVTIDNAGGATNLTVDDSGDSAAQTATISTTTIHGLAPGDIIYSNLSMLTVNGGTGGNTFDVLSTAASAPVTLNTGTGADIVNVGPPAAPLASGTLDNIQGPLTIHAQDATVQDMLIFNDQAETVSNTYTLTATTFTRSGIATVTYDTVASVTLNGGTGGNMYNVESTASGTTYTVNTGPNSAMVHDTINVGSDPTGATGTLDAIQGNLTIHSDEMAGSPVDVLNFNDQAKTTAGLTYTLTATTFTRTGTATVTYDVVASVTLNGGSGGNTYNVEGTAPSTSYTVNTGTNSASSSDGINVGSDPTRATSTLDAIQGNLTIHSQEDFQDELNVNDQAKTTAALIYTLTATTITRTGIATVTFDKVDSVTLSGGSGGNIYNVVSTAATQTGYGIETGAGTDTINVGSDPTGANSTVDAIQGNLGIFSQDAGHQDVINFNDQGNTTAALTYTLRATQITRNDLATVSYDNVASVTLNGGSGGNTYNIESTAAATNSTVNTGAGTDTIDVGASQTVAFIKGPLAIHSQDNTRSDSLFFSDQGNPVDTNYILNDTQFGGRDTAITTYDQMAAVTLNGGTGSNHFDLGATSANTTYRVIAANVNAPSIPNRGQDIFVLGSDFLKPQDQSTLANFKGPLFITSGETATDIPRDSLIFDDQANATASTAYLLNATTFGRTAMAFTTYDQMAAVTLDGGSGNNIYQIGATAGGTTYRLRTGLGADLIIEGSDFLNPANDMTLANIQGPLFISSSDTMPKDSFIFDDQANATVSTAYLLNATTFGRTATAFTTYDQMAAVTLNGGSGNNIYQIGATAAGTTYRLKSGAGADLIIEGSDFLNPANNNTLANFQGPLFIASNDSSPRDSLIFDDQANTSDGKTYLLNATTFGHTATAFTSYDQMAAVTLNTGSIAGFIDVGATAAGTTYRINYGLASPIVNIGTDFLDPVNNNTLSNILGPLFIGHAATSPNGLLFFNDQANANPSLYLLTATTFGRSATAFTTFDSMDAITVNGGSGANTYDMTDTTATTAIAGGGGNDEMFLHDAHGPTTLNGGAGSVQFVIEDTHSTTIVTAAGEAAASGAQFFVNATHALTNLIGGAGNDSFSMRGAATLSGGTINGGGGTNLLDYTAYSTDVQVNLTDTSGPLAVTGTTITVNRPAAHSATGTSGVRNIQTVLGSEISHDASPATIDDVLIGGTGDRLEGRGGNDQLAIVGDNGVLIGGGGTDLLFAQGVGNFLWGGDNADIAADLVNNPNGNKSSHTSPFHDTLVADHGTSTGTNPNNPFNIILVNSAADAAGNLTILFEPDGKGSTDFVTRHQVDAPLGPNNTFRYLPNPPTPGQTGVGAFGVNMLETVPPAPPTPPTIVAPPFGEDLPFSAFAAPGGATSGIRRWLVHVS
jgi:acrosin